MCIRDRLYFKTTDTMKSHWWRLKAKEKEAYLKIISGEEDISYFDTFVKEAFVTSTSISDATSRLSVYG